MIPGMADGARVLFTEEDIQSRVRSLGAATTRVALRR